MAAALVHQAVGDQLTCIFVDNGLLRREEPERVVRTFHKHLQIDLRHIDATDQFLEELAGVIDPETKRKRVGATFIAVFEEAATDLGNVAFMVQGTTYPDVVESAGTGTGGVTATIKSHHNVGGLPERMQFTLVEPLRYLFKDEVRNVGLELGLPPEMVYRQPFPGPGLAIRIIGAVTREKLETLRAADWVVMDEVKDRGPVQRPVAVLRGAHGHAVGGGAGRRPDLRLRGGDSGGDGGGRDDGRLGAAAVRRAGSDGEPDRERGAGRQPRGAGHHLQAAGDHRMGVGLHALSANGGRRLR